MYMCYYISYTYTLVSLMLDIMSQTQGIIYSIFIYFFKYKYILALISYILL